VEHMSNRSPTVSIAVAVAALISAPAWSNATDCTNGGPSRTVEIVYSNPGHPAPCEVIYDKSAEGAGQHSLWRADNEAGFCEAQAAAFVDKLRGLGWTCDTAAAEAPAVEAPAVAEPLAAPEPAPTEEMLGETVEATNPAVDG